jgi:peptide/nickel transport system permease protein
LSVPKCRSDGIIAASLSFLGLGPSEVVPDWGELIQSGQGYIDHDWWISVCPGWW